MTNLWSEMRASCLSDRVGERRRRVGWRALSVGGGGAVGDAEEWEKEMDASSEGVFEVDVKEWKRGDGERIGKLRLLFGGNGVSATGAPVGFAFDKDVSLALHAVGAAAVVVDEGDDSGGGDR